MNSTEGALSNLWSCLSLDEKRRIWPFLTNENRIELERLVPGTEREMLRLYKYLDNESVITDKKWRI